MTDGKLRCISCGQEVERPLGFCPFCGAPFGAPEPPVSRPSDPYLLLMTANVLRLRRQWSLAEAKCSELLRLDPESAAAHSLMGDILRDQGRDQDAIEWYKMAVDRNPANETDRKKLEALIDRRFAEKGQSCAVRVVRSLRERWRKPAREQAPRAACPWAMVTAGVFAITLLAAFALVLMGRRLSPPPLDIRPGSVAVREAAQPVPPASPEQAELTGDITALEQTAFDEVRRKAELVDMNCRVSRVVIDPKQACIDAEISMPSYWSPTETRKGIVKIASALAPVLAQVDTRLASLKVRCLARRSDGTEQLAMVAEGQAAKFREVGSLAPGQSLERAFRSIWWESALRTESEAGATSVSTSGER